MKELFGWAITLDDEEMSRILREAIISFDANILLDLHRLDDAGVTELKKAITLCGGRAWLTNQAAQEYIAHYREVDNFAQSFFESCHKEFCQIASHGEDALNKFKNSHPTNNKDIRERLDHLQGQLKNFMEETKAECCQQGLALNEVSKKNDIFRWVMETFDGKTGPDFAPDDLAAKKEEGKKRYEAKIPPGWKDQEKDEDRRYGDYIVWLQLQDKAKQEKKDMVFVTRDEKEDWVDVLHGKKMPSHALMKEFYFNTDKQRILIFRPDYFLEKFLPLFQDDQQLTPDTQKAIDEIRRLPDYSEYTEYLESPQVRVVRRVRGPAVVRRFEKSIQRDEDTQEGEIEFELTRAVWYFSLSARFRLGEGVGQEITCRFITEPAHTPGFKATCGIGQHQDLNIHLKAVGMGSAFPAGLYRLWYRVETIEVDEDYFDDVPPSDPEYW